MATAVAALFAAFVALLVGLTTALIARRNAGLQAVINQQMKHAEFRQAWIDTLRQEMATLRALALTSTHSSLASGTGDGAVQSAAKARFDILASATTVRLMMDRKDQDYDRLVDLIEKIEAESFEGADTGEGPRDKDLHNFIEVCQDILKREWEVTKADMHRLPAEYARSEEAKRRRA
ncbi:MAG TPA: hypothetical protein VF662_01175 [Allosphingosinicella sp.]